MPGSLALASVTPLLLLPLPGIVQRRSPTPQAQGCVD
jgi:hypothetical protein